VSTLTISNPSGLVYPTGVAVDSSQNIYAASGAEDVDEVLSGTGLVNLIGGQSYTAGPGYNGPATLITMNNPQGIGVDSFGNVYVADTANNMIREITVSTSPVSMIVFAGQETAGYVDATGVAAQFSQPWGIAVDKSNNVYVGDTGNGVIRIISPSGAVTTFAGKSYGSAITLTNGPASIASFNGTDGIALDNNGNFYVTETGYEDVRKITISGGTTMVSTLAGSGVAAFNNANGILAEFNSPIGVAVDSSGNVYVADQNNQLIRKITPGGDVSTLAGQTSSHGSSNGQGSAASFYNPQGLAIDQNGILYVGDAQNNLIRIIQ
jgi:sugar lactone lactonase YvrE